LGHHAELAASPVGVLACEYTKGVSAIEKCNSVFEVMLGFDKSWAIAGGWAIDLFLGKVTREHDDIEIIISRQDQSKVRMYLKDWNFRKINNGRVEVWGLDEWLYSPIHEASAEKLPQKIEILINEFDREYWIYRRDSRIRRPVSETIIRNEIGIPYLSPEIALLYKSKNPRLKDDVDFRATTPHLNVEQRHWLLNSLKTIYAEHPWIQLLSYQGTES
jgi:hypothetical protein